MGYRLVRIKNSSIINYNFLIDLKLDINQEDALLLSSYLNVKELIKFHKFKIWIK